MLIVPFKKYLLCAIIYKENFLLELHCEVKFTLFCRMINLDTVDKVKNLVSEATALSFEVNIITERFTVNAKSILGIFSLNRSLPMKMVLEADENNAEAIGFLEKIKDYLVE